MKMVLGALVLTASLLALTGESARAEEKKKEETKKVDARIYELRTYYVLPGRMPAMQARFRDHTTKLFEKHGMTVVGFWNPSNPKEADTKLIYMLSYPSKEAAEKSWKAFQADPVWKEAREASEKDGKIVDHVDSVYLNPTDYSPLK
jgi:NIPSNAP